MIKSCHYISKTIIQNAQRITNNIGDIDITRGIEQHKRKDKKVNYNITRYLGEELCNTYCSSLQKKVNYGKLCRSTSLIDPSLLSSSSNSINFLSST